MKYTRNAFLKLTGIGLSAAVLPPLTNELSPGTEGKENTFNLALASYTLRNFGLDETINMSVGLGLTGISLKSMHLPLESPPEEIKKAAQKVRNAGLNLYGAGVIYMKTQEEVEKAFAYAAAAELEMIIGVPNYEWLPLTEKLVKQYDIKLAIHNHGPGDLLYSSPADVYEKIKSLDKRIGMCIDIGHVQRIGLDPAAMLEKYKDRLYDMHMKDVIKTDTVDVPAEIGRGMIDIPKVLRTLKKIKYKGQVAFEYEKDGNNPLPGLAESVGYVKGVMRVI